MNVSILPASDSTYDLGSSSYRWRYVYAKHYRVEDSIWNGLDIGSVVPLLLEGTLFDALAFNPPDKVELLDASTGEWVESTSPESYYALFTGGWGPVWINISNAYNGIRFTWTGFPYRFIKAIWMYISPKDNRFNVKVELSSDGSTWEQVLYDTNLSGWPGYYIHVFDTYISTYNRPYLRITIEINWTGTTTSVAIGGIRLFAEYDWLARINHLPFTANYARDLTFYGSLRPSDDNSYDLGTGSLRWRTLYVSAIKTMDNTGATIPFFHRAASSPNTHFHFLADYTKPSGATDVSVWFGYNSEIMRFEFKSKWSGSNVTLLSLRGDQLVNYSRTFLPLSDSAYDLGSGSYRWRYLYVAQNIFVGTGYSDTVEGAIRVTGGYRWIGLTTRNKSYDWLIGDDASENFEISLYDHANNTYNWGIFEITPAPEVHIKAPLLPQSDNAYDLGSSSHRWANVYGVGIHADGFVKVSAGTPYLLLDNTGTGAVQNHIRFSFAGTEYFRIYTQEDVNVFGVWAYRKAGEANSRAMFVIDAENDLAKFNVAAVPTGDGAYDLGSFGYHWNVLWVNEIKKKYDMAIKFEGENLRVYEPEDSNATAYLLVDLGSGGAFRHTFYYGGAAVLQLDTEAKVGKTLRPLTDNSIDLGTSSYRWRDIWSSGKVVSDGYIAAQGGSSITSNPPTIPTSRLGWKIGLWGSGYWLGIANWTLAVRTDSWLSVFKRTNPANDASSATPDSNAGVSLGGSTGKEIWFGRDFRLISGGTGLLQINASIRPDADNAYDLGSESYRWANVYGLNLHANVFWLYDSGWVNRFKIDLDEGNNRIVFRSPYGWPFQFNQSVVPGSDSSSDLGSADYRWRNGYFAGFVKAKIPLPLARYVRRVKHYVVDNYWGITDGNGLVALPVGATLLNKAAMYTLAGEKGTVSIVAVDGLFEGVAYAVSGDSYPLPGDVEVYDTGTGERVYDENHEFSGHIRVGNGLVRAELYTSGSRIVYHGGVYGYVEGEGWVRLHDDFNVFITLLDGTQYRSWSSPYTSFYTYPVKVTPDEVVIRSDETNTNTYFLLRVRRGLPYITIEFHRNGNTDVKNFGFWWYERLRFVARSGGGSMTDFEDWLVASGSGNQNGDNIFIRFGPKGNATGAERRKYLTGVEHNYIWVWSADNLYSVSWSNWNSNAVTVDRDVVRAYVGYIPFPTENLWKDAINMTKGSGTAQEIADPPSPSTLTLVSDSADDTMYVSITGYDTNGKIVVDHIQMQGTTEVTTSKTFAKILLIDFESATNGNITVKDSAGNTLASLPSGSYRVYNRVLLDAQGEYVEDIKTMESEIPYGQYKLVVWVYSDNAVSDEVTVTVEDVGVGTIASQTYGVSAGWNKLVLAIDLSTSTVTNSNKQVRIRVEKASSTSNTLRVWTYALFPYKRNSDTPSSYIFPYELCHSMLHEVEIAEPAPGYSASSFLPLDDAVFSLGSEERRWKQLFVYNPDNGRLSIVVEGLGDVGIELNRTDGTRWNIHAGGVGLGIYDYAASSYAMIFTANGDIVSYRAIRPQADNAYDLGSGSNRWRYVYIGNTLYIRSGDPSETTHRHVLKIGRSGAPSSGNPSYEFYLGYSGESNNDRALNLTGYDPDTGWRDLMRWDYYGQRAWSRHLLPFGNAVYDLGSSSYRWRNLYWDGTLYGSSGSKIAIGTSSPLGDVHIVGTADIRLQASSGATTKARLLAYSGSASFWIEVGTEWSSGSTADIIFSGMYGSPVFAKITSGGVLPGSDNAYDLGSSSLRWRDLYLGGALYFADGVEFLPKGIYAYKLKHSEGSHPTELHDFLYRFVFKYLDNVQASALIDGLSHTFNDDYYTGIYAALVYVASDGYYDIGVNSDDASAVFVDGVLATAWLSGHGVIGSWYKTSFNSVCNGLCDVDGDGNNEPCHRTTLHPNGIYLSRGWHLVVAVFEEVGGGDRIEVYIRPHRDEDPSTGSGTSTGWAVIGSDAASAGYILDYRAVPLGAALWMLSQMWKAVMVPNPERGRVVVYGDMDMNGYDIINVKDYIKFTGGSDKVLAIQGESGCKLYIENEDKLGAFRFDTPNDTFYSRHTVPVSDSAYDLGSSGYRWRYVYASKVGVFGASDTYGISTGVVAGGEGGGIHLVINDIDGARWALATGSYDLTFYKHRADTGTWEEAMRLEGDAANNVPQGVTVRGFVRPKSDNAYDLGSSTYRWRNLYLAGSPWLYGGSVYLPMDQGDTFYVYDKNSSQWILQVYKFWEASDGTDSSYTYTFNGSLLPRSGSQYSLGSSSQPWHSVYAVNVYASELVQAGDLAFRNGWRLTEDPVHGLVLVSPEGKRYRFVLKELN